MKKDRREPELASRAGFDYLVEYVCERHNRFNLHQPYIFRWWPPARATESIKGNSATLQPIVVRKRPLSAVGFTAAVRQTGRYWQASGAWIAFAELIMGEHRWRASQMPA